MNRNLFRLMLLISDDTDLNMDLGIGGLTPLHAVVGRHDVEIARYLINHGANANAELHIGKWNGRTPLHVAAWKCNENMIKLLLNNNADVNSYELFMRPPIIAAARRQDNFIVSLFLSRGANINSSINEGPDERITLVHIAAQCETTEMVQFLLYQETLNVYAVTRKNETPLHNAAKNYYQNKSIVQVLLDAGVDINVENSEGKLTIDCVVIKRDGKGYRIIDVMKRHIVKLIQANIGNVCPKNIAKVKSPKFDSLRAECTEDVNEMKIMRMGTTSTTFYDTLKKNIHQLALDLTYNPN